MHKTKTIIRVKKTANFVMISRFPLEDVRLTWEARGLYGFLLAKPDNWQISLNHLTKSSPAGYDKTKRILKELLNYKYVRKEEHRNKRGQFSYPAYTIYELPYDGYFTAAANPSTVNPVTVETDTETPSMENPQLTKKQGNKDTKTTTKTLKEYEWPQNIDVNEKIAIEKIIKNESINPVVVQKALNEISFTNVFTKGPVHLFHHFWKEEMNGGFTPSCSDHDEKKLKEKEIVEKNYQDLLKQSEQVLEDMIKKQGKS